MSISKEHRELGMDRPIARRDFLNGIALAIAGAGVVAQAQSPAGSEASTYPPLRDGLRGNYPAAVDIFDPIRKGQYAQFPVSDSDIREEYDLVIGRRRNVGIVCCAFLAFGARR